MLLFSTHHGWNSFILNNSVSVNKITLLLRISLFVRGIEIPGICNSVTFKYSDRGRHRIKKRIIVGNVSKYIPPDKREGNDNSSHKWMVYVRGSAEEPRIDHFVRKVGAG